ncbi:diacylglycerol kinase delta-like isoform X4 [Acanthaster planci]|uniref:Diacylglycerol kinase n=1 Tax=Acanthaster planci TaxID=133434 RepID=A0A8B7YPU1_ACAPL|nr:diacylglycerol kinase delta-like isoform X4 [Acanthaster planci]
MSAEDLPQLLVMGGPLQPKQDPCGEQQDPSEDRTKACIKEGFLMKQTSSFQRWRRRYFKLKGRNLYYAKESTSHIFEEVDLREISVAENSTKNVNNSFRVITPFRTLILCTDTRKDMEEWISAFKSVANRDFYEEGEHMRDMLSGMHNWYACSHARPTYCNVCREALSGVTSHGLSCEVCKFKAHKRCAVRAQNNCKWTTLASVGKDIIEEDDGTISTPHQWLEGNLPVSAKCVVCDKTCGSVLRLQDWRCLWCKAMVHSTCKPQYPAKCPLGQCRLSLLPPISLNSMSSDGYWQATRQGCSSPLLVFVNSRSGDNQGVKFLRRFKQLLNPAQVFDLMNSGPHIGLRLFQNFDTFRILVCGGDGSIGWVLSEIDKLDLHKQCQIGVLPLGTGNDLARVLGWGTACDDDTQLPTILEKLERASTKMLDRWSICTKESPLPTSRRSAAGATAGDLKADSMDVSDSAESKDKEMITAYEDSVAAHLTKILHCDENTDVISSAKVLCETVKDFVEKVGRAYEQSCPTGDAQIMKEKCAVLNEKLKLLLQTLEDEAQATPIPPGTLPPTMAAATAAAVTGPSLDEACKDSLHDGDTLEQMTGPSTSGKVFKPRDALMSRANSLKKAVRQIIEQTEKAVDEQNAQTQHHEAKAKALADKAAMATTSSLPSAPTVTTTTAEVYPLPPQPTITIVAPPAEEGEEKEKDDRAEKEKEGGVEGEEKKGGEGEASATESGKEAGKTSFSVFTSATKAKIERKKAEREQLRSPRTRRVSRGSTLSPGPVGLAHRFGSMENIAYLPGLDTLLGPSLGRGNTMLSKSISGLSGGFVGAGLISKVLLANADALCAAASPLMDQDIESVEGYTETCVMNNYFGIGLDAKVTLDFHNKREEHPEKCSRTKNMMWYGVLGGKELLQRTYRNLEQKVQLECDGQRIPLPSLQGIVVLNIPSYMGGANFWGSTKEDETFTAPSFDDRILEVVAVFGGMQMAVSRMITLQHHRIAQCHVVKITILGEEGVPVQVDGEAWVQPPGFIKIIHKNRAQMLVRDKAFENTLKSWTDRKKLWKQLQPLSDEEVVLVRHFCETVNSLVTCIQRAAEQNRAIESGLMHYTQFVTTTMDRFWGSEKVGEGTSRKALMELVNSVRNLHSETSLFLAAKAYTTRLSDEILNRLNSAVSATDVELRKVMQIEGALGFPDDEPHQPDAYIKRTKGRFKLPMVSRLKKPTKRELKPALAPGSPGGSSEGASSGESSRAWTPQQVGLWLDSLSLGEYRDNFIRNDIRGSELLTLERRDLKDIGVTKVGHIKRIQQAIKELEKRDGEQPGPSYS